LLGNRDGVPVFPSSFRKIKEINEDFRLKEDIETSVTVSDWKNCDIERKNTYFVGVNNESTACQWPDIRLDPV
jgi:hypothetical protein